jgi:hypothetical protein
MSDPPRLSTRDANSMEAMLLRSAEGDDPPAGAHKRMLVALSLGTEALLSAGTASGTAAASGAGSGLAFAVAKWAGIGIAAGALTVTAVHVAGPTRQATAVSPAPPEAVAIVGPARPGPAPPSLAPAATAAPVAAEGQPELSPEAPKETRFPRAPTGEAPMVAARSSKPTAVPAPLDSPAGRAMRDPLPTPPSLSDEVLALDGARDQLSRRQPAKALELLDRYDAAFPGGRLALEAKVLRIETLVARGDRASASRLAREFLAENPSSAHVGRVRSLLQSIEKGAVP